MSRWFVTVDGKKLVTMVVEADGEAEALAKAKEVWSDDTATYKATAMGEARTLFGG